MEEVALMALPRDEVDESGNKSDSSDDTNRSRSEQFPQEVQQSVSPLSEPKDIEAGAKGASGMPPPFRVTPSVLRRQNSALDSAVSAIEEDDDYTIKCFCGFQFDDGNTIFCDRCETRQHIECYYFEHYRNGMAPDVTYIDHACVDCSPRAYDKRSAIERQKSRFWPGERIVKKVIPGTTSFENYVEEYLEEARRNERKLRRPSIDTIPPTTIDDNTNYLGHDDIVDIPRNASRTDSANPTSPDVLIFKHRGIDHVLHFPALMIAGGELRILELRRLAAKELKCEDSRRIKLLYKGEYLEDDAKACRDEGLKHKSELMCVVVKAPTGGSSQGLRNESRESAQSYPSSHNIENWPTMGDATSQGVPIAEDIDEGGVERGENDEDASALPESPPVTVEEINKRSTFRWPPEPPASLASAPTLTQPANSPLLPPDDCNSERLTTRASKEYWAQHQDLIKQLYLDEGHTLKEVMKVMETQYGFKAT